MTRAMHTTAARRVPPSLMPSADPEEGPLAPPQTASGDAIATGRLLHSLEMGAPPISQRRPDGRFGTAPLSIAAIGRHIRLLLDQHNELDERVLKLNNGSDFLAKEQIERSMALADDRQHALQDLALTLPARSMADVAVQLTLVAQIIYDLGESEYSDFEEGRKRREVRRGIASVLPVVATSAGITLEELGGTWLAGLPGREFPDLGELP